MGFSIERTARFEELEILERPILCRVKYSIREMAVLSKHLDKFRSYSEKIDRKANDSDIKGYEASVNECIQLIVKEDADRKFIEEAVLDVDSESDNIIDIREFVDFIQYVLKADEEASEEDSGKADSGSDNS